MCAGMYVHSCATGSRVGYSAVPPLGLKIYDLGDGVHGGHIKQNRPLLHPGLFPLHGWHYFLSPFALLLLFYLALSFNKNSYRSFVVCVGLSNIVHCFFFFFFKQPSICLPLEKVRQWKWIQRHLSLVSGSFHVILLALQSKNSRRRPTCGCRLKNSPNQQDFGARKSKTGRLFRPVSSLIELGKTPSEASTCAWLGQWWRAQSSDHRWDLGQFSRWFSTSVLLPLKPMKAQRWETPWHEHTERVMRTR